MPSGWSWSKTDFRNIKYIHKEFGSKRIKTYPHFPISRFFGKYSGNNIEFIHLLNYMPYKKFKAIKILKDEYGWREYGGKHYESAFTKFYQAYILPNKFNIDKRVAHLSALIRNGEITKEEAKNEMMKPIVELSELKRDLNYFCKKLDFSLAEFDEIMKMPPKLHDEYKNDGEISDILIKIKKFLFRR